MRETIMKIYASSGGAPAAKEEALNLQSFRTIDPNSSTCGSFRG